MLTVDGYNFSPVGPLVKEEDFPFIIATSITIIRFSCDLIMFAK